VFKKSHNSQTNLNLLKLKSIINDYLVSSNTVPLIDFDLILYPYLFVHPSDKTYGIGINKKLIEQIKDFFKN